MKRATIAGILCLSAAVLGADAARAEEKIRVFVNGTLFPSQLSFDENRKITDFGEEGSGKFSYKEKRGLGGEAGILIKLGKRFGIAGGVAFAKRDGSGTYDVKLPHPFYFQGQVASEGNKLRTASGSTGSLSYQETAAHLDLVYDMGGEKWDLLLFGGGSLINVKADVAKQIDYTQSYPYDTITVTGVPTQESSDSPVGFNVGASLDYKVSQRFGLGLQGRFSRASAKLKPNSANTISLDAGGFDVALGVRFYF